MKRCAGCAVSSVWEVSGKQAASSQTATGVHEQACSRWIELLSQHTQLWEINGDCLSHYIFEWLIVSNSRYYTGVIPEVLHKVHTGVVSKVLHKLLISKDSATGSPDSEVAPKNYQSFWVMDIHGNALPVQ